MVIDVFKDEKFFESLVKHNQLVNDICKSGVFTFAKDGEEYDIPNNKVSRWFNPDYLPQLYFPRMYPKGTPMTRHPKFNLLLFFPNYITLYVTHLLYQNQKDILIEDMAAGMGRLAYYLSKQGFSNFHLTENFSQVSPLLLKTLMKKGNVPYRLNEPNTQPVIANLVSWTAMTREDFPESLELFFFYNSGDWNLVSPIGETGNFNARAQSGKYVPMTNFRLLCEDVDGLMRIFCRNDKYVEFARKLTGITS